MEPNHNKSINVLIHKYMEPNHNKSINKINHGTKS